MPSPSDDPKPRITIADFLGNAPPALALELIAGRGGLDSREISSDRIQKLGLALTGFSEYIHYGRVLVVGKSEVSYLDNLKSEQRAAAFERLDPGRICCILITKSLAPPSELIKFAGLHDLPLLHTPLVSSRAIATVSRFLGERLAPTVTLHGVLLELFGIGVLLLGESGIGKSECALDLVVNGHRLVSDDSVRIKRIGEVLEGDSPELTRGHLEIHGLGIINIRDLFGNSAFSERAEIRLCIELRRWEDAADGDRLGLEQLEHEIFGQRIPKFVLPVRPGRNLAILVETAVKLYLLKRTGRDSVRELILKHSAMVRGDL